MRKVKNIQIIASFSIVFALLSFQLAFGQDKSSNSKVVGGMGYFMIGIGSLDIDGVNTRLEAAGMSTFSNNFLSLGGGGHSINGNLILGGEGHGMGVGEISEGDYTSSLSVGYGFFDIGYAVYSTDAFYVYPLIGIGGGGMSVRIVERGTSPSFNDVLENPKRGVEISTGGFLLNLSLGTDYVFAMEKGKNGRGGFSIGLRIGYVFTPIKGDWSMDETKLSGSPETAITGPYVRLLLGGGGFGVEKK